MNKKIVIVTGGTRGIGRAIAVQLLGLGYEVHICARDESELKETALEFSKVGKINSFVLDISNREKINHFVGKWNKPLYGLVNNAGIWAEERIDEPDTGIWDRILNLNLNGLYFLTKGLTPFLSDSGRIINISSQLGMGGREGFGAYCASKHGVIGLTKCWALELGPKQITVNAVCPGWIKTQSNIDEIHAFAEKEGKTFEQKFKELSDPLTLKRFIEVEEVANLVSFLVSEKGSGITGQVYEIK